MRSLPPNQPPLKLRRSAEALAKAEAGSHLVDWFTWSISSHMHNTRTLFVAAGLLVAGLLVSAQQPAPPTPPADPAAAPGQGPGRGQRGGRGPGRGAPRVRKTVLAWADTRNGIAQHDSVSHALAVIERIGYESGAYDTYIRTDSHIISKTPQKTSGEPASGGPNLNNVDAIFFMGHRGAP